MVATRRPDLFTALASGRMLLWIALDGADIACVMLTQIEQYPRRQGDAVCGAGGSSAAAVVVATGGSGAGGAQEAFRCDLMEALHQPAHARLLTTGGWRAIWHVLSEKRL